MNIILVLLLAGAIYLFLEAGLVFFAMIVGVALLLGLISSSFSERSESRSQHSQAPSPAAPAAPPKFVKQDHSALQAFWKTVGIVFNFFGKGIYRFLRYGFQTATKKHD